MSIAQGVLQKFRSTARLPKRGEGAMRRVSRQIDATAYADALDRRTNKQARGAANRSARALAQKGGK